MTQKVRVIYYHDGMVRDIPYKSVEISGDTAQAYRSCQINVNNTLDGRTQAIPFHNGSEIRILYGSSELFRGILFEHGTGLSGDQTLTVHDANVYLVKNSDSVRFENMTATQIIISLCNKYGIETGELANTRYVIPRLIERGKTLFDIVLEALKLTKKESGIRYRLRNIDGKLNLVEEGGQTTQLYLENRRNIMNANYSASIEDTKTRVKLTGGDEDNPVVVEVSSPNASQYGVMQHYEHNSDVNTADKLRPLANELLAQLSEQKQEFSVEAVGDIDVVSATTVIVNETMTGIEGAFYVESDAHRFDASGLHTMSLTLTRKGGG